MHDAGILIPITLFISTAAMIFGIVYLRTKENLAMLEKGFNPKQYTNRPAPYRSLKTGLLLAGAGLGLLLAFFIDRSMNLHDSEATAIYFSMIAICGGLGLISSYAVEKKEWMNRKNDVS